MKRTDRAKYIVEKTNKKRVKDCKRIRVPKFPDTKNKRRRVNKKLKNENVSSMDGRKSIELMVEES